MTSTGGLKLLNIGFGNAVVADRVVAVFNPSSAPMKRLREEARVVGKLVDATQGRRTRAIVITDSDHVILSAIQAETVAHRLRAAGSVDLDAAGEHQSGGGTKVGCRNDSPSPSDPAIAPAGDER